MPTEDVSVIGAGPAGLTAAFFLLKHQLQPCIYEAGQEIGGLAGAVTLWGKTFDIGPHIFLESSQPAAVNFWKDIGGNDLQRLVLKRGMILNNCLIPYPPKPINLLKALGPFKFFACAASLVKAKLVSPKVAKTAGDFFSRYYGDYLRGLIFNPFCQKYMGVADSEVDINFATGLTSFVKEAGKTDVLPEKKKLNTLLFHKDGTKAMWQLIAEKILAKGNILFEKKLLKIITSENRISGLIFSDGTVVHPNIVVSTLPLTLMLNMIDDCPTEILNEKQNLSTRNTVLVYYRLTAPAFSFQYVTIFDHSLEAGRITNFSNWKNDSHDLTTVVCVEYWCDLQSKHWQVSNEEIIKIAGMELVKSAITSKENLLDAQVVRVPNSHPVLDIKYASALERINKYLSRFENLILAGRHATFKWDGQADNIIAGINIANKVAKLKQSGL